MMVASGNPLHSSLLTQCLVTAGVSICQLLILSKSSPGASLWRIPIQQSGVPWVTEKELNIGKMEIVHNHHSRRSWSRIPESSFPYPTPRLPLIHSLFLVFKLQ